MNTNRANCYQNNNTSFSAPVDDKIIQSAIEATKAEQNDYAKYYFALMNLLGVGVAPDDTKGIALLTELSDKGFESAKSYLDLLHLVGKHYDIFAYAKNQDDAMMIGRLIATIFDLLENTEEETGSKALFIESVIKLYKENEHNKSRVSYVSLFKTLLGTKAENRGYHMAQFFYQNWSEEEDGVYYTEEEKWCIKDIKKHTTYPNMNIYNYKKYQFTCRECGWQGLGIYTEVIGDVLNGDVIGCPKCRKIIKCVYYPSDNEVLKYGSVKQKANTRRHLAEHAIFHAEWEEFHKEYPTPTIDQLPEIDAKQIVITLREEIHEGKGWPHMNRSFIILSWNDKSFGANRWALSITRHIFG